MIYEITSLIILLTGLIFATISDLKTREVPNWLNFSLIISGLSLALFRSISFGNFYFLLYSLIGLGVFFMLGTVMYYARQWGGGDAKLCMGFGALIPAQQTITHTFNFILVSVINIFIIGSVWGLFYTAYLIVKNRKQFSKYLKKDFKKHKNILLVLVFISLGLGILILFSTSMLLASITTLMLLLTVFIIFIIKSFENISMCKTIKASQLTEGDWVTSPINYKRKTIYSPESQGITKEKLTMLQKKCPNVKVQIKEGLPFVPGIFLGILATLIWGNVIALILS